MKWTFKKTFYWSLGGHAALFILLLLVSVITSCSKNRTPEKVHIFSLQAGPPAPKPAAVTPPQKTVTPPKKETKQPQRKPEPKPVPPKEEPKPDKKPVEEPQPQRNPVSYDEFVKTHDLPKPEREPVAVTPPATPSDPNKELRSELEQLIQGFEGQDPDVDQMRAFNQYVGQLRSQLNRLWLQPDNLPPGKWTALIEFTVASNGKVGKVRFKQESGNLDFDQSLIRAMNAFSATSPPPGGRAQVFTIPFSMTVR